MLTAGEGAMVELTRGVSDPGIEGTELEGVDEQLLKSTAIAAHRARDDAGLVP